MPDNYRWLLWLWRRKEAFLWIAALVFLALSHPADHHYTLCPLNNLGFYYCPGCGLGRSISYLFRLDFQASFMSHPLGIPALIMLLYRAVRVLSKPSVKMELST